MQPILLTILAIQGLFGQTRIDPRQITDAMRKQLAPVNGPVPVGTWISQMVQVKNSGVITHAPDKWEVIGRGHRLIVEGQPFTLVWVENTPNFYGWVNVSGTGGWTVVPGGFGYNEHRVINRKLSMVGMQTKKPYAVLWASETYPVWVASMGSTIALDVK